MITKPLLPPMAGFVERVDPNGKHYYEPTADTIKKQQQETELAKMRDMLNDLLGITE